MLLDRRARPRYIKLLLTSRCNLHCKMCRSYDRNLDEMSSVEIFAIIDILARNYCF